MVVKNWTKKHLRVQYMHHRNCSILLCLLWNLFLKFSVWWLQFLWHENELTVTPPSRNCSMSAATTQGLRHSHWTKSAAPVGRSRNADALIGQNRHYSRPLMLLIGPNRPPPPSGSSRQINALSQQAFVDFHFFHSNLYLLYLFGILMTSGVQ